MLSLKASGMTNQGCINALVGAIKAPEHADPSTQVVLIRTALSAAKASQLITDAGFLDVQ